MSFQSDVELLSVKAVEEYAKRNHLSTLSAIEIFHKYQVFEKIMLQHEYLHQVDFEEVMEYVEMVIRDKFHQLTVFHGTIARFDKVELKKSHNRRDFGMGFYTTILESQAKEWAYRLKLRVRAKEYFVYQYSFEEDRSLNIKRFDGLDTEWLEFIKINRSLGGLHHKYDVVIGPVADDNTMETVQLYMSGILNTSEAVERLRYSKVNNQISFHTKKALQYLKFIRRERYE